MNATCEKLLKDSPQALAFLQLLVRVLHFWDDLLDGDKEVTQEILYRRLDDALLLLPMNPFYLANQAFLQPILAMAIIDWRTANALEQAGELPALRIAYILRSSYWKMVTATVLLVKGMPVAEQLNLDLWRNEADSFEDYCTALTLEKRRT